MTVTLWVVGIILILIGILGTILPALPGSPLVLLGLILAAWANDFQEVGIFTICLLAALTILTLLVDIFATAIGVKKIGASSYAVWGSMLGAIFGIFAGIPGLIFGPFLGALIGEYFAKRDLLRAGTVGIVTWVALLVGVALKLSIIISMVGIFLLAYLV